MMPEEKEALINLGLLFAIVFGLTHATETDWRWIALSGFSGTRLWDRITAARDAERGIAPEDYD